MSLDPQSNEAAAVDVGSMFHFREPGEDDDLSEPDELVPLGTVLREIELDMRERALAGSEVRQRFERDIHTQMRDLARRTLWAARDGKRAPSEMWAVLGYLEMERLHGGAERVWVDGTDGRRGEWRTKFKKACTFARCKWCGGARS